jgi:hypothetical protein
MRTSSQLLLISTQEGVGGVLWLGDIHFRGTGDLLGIGPAFSLASPPAKICTRRLRNSSGDRCIPLLCGVGDKRQWSSLRAESRVGSLSGRCYSHRRMVRLDNSSNCCFGLRILGSKSNPSGSKPLVRYEVDQPSKRLTNPIGSVREEMTWRRDKNDMPRTING